MQTQDRYTSGAYVDQIPGLHVEDSAWKANKILKMLARHRIQPQTVCDVGCGAGEILRCLQPHLDPGTVLHGYEISPPAIEICKRNENARLKYFCQDLLAFGGDPYDLLLCMDVFEHVPDYLGFLRVLRARSELKIFHIPLEFSARYAWFPGTILKHRSQLGHLHYFNRETALATLEEAGYSIVDSFYTPAWEQSLAVVGRRERLIRSLFRFASDDLSAHVIGGYSLLVLAR